MSVDGAGNSCATGWFTDTVDFDAGPVVRGEAKLLPGGAARFRSKRQKNKKKD